jgi:3-dehydroquinate synthase
MTTNILHTVPVKLPGGRSYEIIIGTGILNEIGRAVQDAGGGTARAVLITDTAVDARHGDAVRAVLKKSRVDTHTIVIPAGERSKNFKQYEKLLIDINAADGLHGVVVVALGGGVVGDLAGFAAATYKRGIPFVQVPTTLLACVDSSVGGKTAIDLPAGKNLVGAFHQPARVVMDLDLLRPLPPRELRAGYAEAAKTALIFDEKLFKYLEANLDAVLSLEPGAAAQVIRRCCELKAAVVSRDERDVSGLRALLNFGHTFGHAAEAALGFRRIRHGEAVAVGMLCAAELSRARGLISKDIVSRMEIHFAAAGLPTAFKGCSVDDIFSHIKYDKKFAAGKTRLVLLEKIGRATLVSGIPEKQIKSALEMRVV